MRDKKRIRSLSNKELAEEIASTEVLVTIYSQHLELLNEESGMRTKTLRCLPYIKTLHNVVMIVFRQAYE
jgi:hypothetical protein